MSASTTASTTTTTTTTTLPADPQPSPDAAATAFLDGWVKDDRSASARVAVPAAVDELYAHPYAGQPLISRQCSTAFPPIVCSYGPAGGANPAGALYEITLAETVGRWYVVGVTIDQ